MFRISLRVRYFYKKKLKRLLKILGILYDHLTLDDMMTYIIFGFELCYTTLATLHDDVSDNYELRDLMSEID